MTITTPQEDQVVADTVALEANATDNVGVIGVQWRLDDQPLDTERASAPYHVDWNTIRTSEGPHKLTALARDAAGNRAEAIRRVVVRRYAAAVTAVVLIDAETGEALPEALQVKDQGTLDRSRLPANVNLQAVTVPGAVGSVRFKLDDQPETVDATAPYTVCPSAGSVLPPCEALTQPGTHRLIATPRRGADGTGDAGNPLAITFTMVDSSDGGS